MKPLEFRCVVHGEPLRLEGDHWVGVDHQERYPIVDGIPVLIADRQDRERLVAGKDSEELDGSALKFYNKTSFQDEYSRTQLDDIAADIRKWAKYVHCEGFALEIGPGKGALQGLDDDYVACDYSLLALRRCIRPSYHRVCASAEHLPLPDASCRLVFSIAALEHVPNAALAFEEIDRVLAPGGVAYLAPAWHCIQANCEGIPVRPYRDLSMGQKVRKALLPLSESLVVKGLRTFPKRMVRRSLWAVGDAGPTKLHHDVLRPDYSNFWMSDSDAVSRIDSHEGCLFFSSRGYRMLQPSGGRVSQLLMRHGALVVQKYFG